MKHPSAHRAFLTILALNVLVYVLGFFVSAFPDALAMSVTDSWPMLAAHMVTCMFAHAGFWHIFGNMFFVTPFALYLEPKIGSTKFLAYWLLTGLGASTLFLATPALFGWTSCLGASGACFGIATLALAHVDEHRLWVYLALALMLLLTWPEYANTVMGFLLPSGVAHSAHLGGFLTALLIKSKDCGCSLQ